MKAVVMKRHHSLYKELIDVEWDTVEQKFTHVRTENYGGNRVAVRYTFDRDDLDFSEYNAIDGSQANPPYAEIAKNLSNSPVDHPKYYQGMEVIDAMELAYGTADVMAFCRCN